MLFSVAKEYSIVLMSQSLFTHPPAEGRLDYFQLLTIKNKTALNVAVRVFV